MNVVLEGLHKLTRLGRLDELRTQSVEISEYLPGLLFCEDFWTQGEVTFWLFVTSEVTTRAFIARAEQYGLLLLEGEQTALLCRSAIPVC
jgi:hypothetical protein